jgi:hypothetical protein
MNNSRLWLTVSTVLILIVWLTTACGAGEPQVVTVIVTHEATTPSEIEQEPTLTQVPSEIAVTATPSTSDLALLVHAEFARLAAGHILYNPPEEMRVGELERVAVRITRGTTETLLVETVRGRGEPVVEQLPVSTFKKVRLIGDAFAITSLSSEEQFVVEDSYTEWMWDVIPLRGGEQKLTILVTARVLLSGFPAEQRDLSAVERQIRVYVNPVWSIQYFVRENRAVLISAVFIPLITAIGVRLWQKYWVPTPADAGPSAEEQ